MGLRPFFLRRNEDGLTFSLLGCCPNSVRATGAFCRACVLLQEAGVAGGSRFLGLVWSLQTTNKRIARKILQTKHMELTQKKAIYT